MDTLLWGWKNSPLTSSIELERDEIDTRSFKKPISSESKIWSDILSTRLKAPLLIDPTSSSLTKTPEETLHIPSSSKLKFSKISQNAKRMLVFGRSNSTRKDEKQASINRIREKILPTTVALDLLGFSHEMGQLRELFLNRNGCLDNLSSEELLIIERDAELLGRHANQSKLLDPTDASLSIAKHLRAIWEIIYFRASGGVELPPVPFENISEDVLEAMPSLILKDGIEGFGQYCSDPESEEDDSLGESENDENFLIEDSEAQPSDEVEERSPNIGLPADDVDEMNETPRWTFTSESVEDYLKRRDEEKKMLGAQNSFIGTNSLSANKLSSRRRSSLPQIREIGSNINDDDSVDEADETNNSLAEILEAQENAAHDKPTEIECPDLRPRSVSAVISNNTRKFSSVSSQVVYSRRSLSIFQKGYLHKVNQRTGTEFRNSSGHIAPPPMFQPLSPLHPKSSVSSPEKLSPSKKLTLKPPPVEDLATIVVEGADSRPVTPAPLVSSLNSNVNPEANTPINSLFETSQDTTQQVLKEQDVTLQPLNPLSLPNNDNTPFQPYLNIWHPEELGPSSYHLLVVLPYDLIEKKDKEIPKIVSYIPPLLHWKNKTRIINPPTSIFLDDEVNPNPPQISSKPQDDQIHNPTRSPSPKPSGYSPIPVVDINSSASFNESFDWMDFYHDRMLTPHLPTQESDVPHLYRPSFEKHPHCLIEPISLSLNLDLSSSEVPKDNFFHQQENIKNEDSRSLSLGTKDHDNDIKSEVDDTSRQIHQQLIELNKGQFLVEGMRTHIGLRQNQEDLLPKQNPPQGYIYRYNIADVNSQSKAKRFISLPMNSKGNDFNELYFDDRKQHFCYQCIRNNTLVNDISIPFHEITATKSIFENMITLRYAGKEMLHSLDYISTIPIDDWKAILHQQKFQRDRPPSLEQIVEGPNSEVNVTRQLNVMMNDADLITDSLTRSIALSSVVSPPIGKSIYMKEDPDNDLAKHFNQMHDQYLNSLTSDSSSKFQLHHPSYDLSEPLSSIFITRNPPEISHPLPKTGTLVDEDEGTLEIPMKSHRQIYRTYAPSGSYHVMSSLTPSQEAPKVPVAPPASAPINVSPRRNSFQKINTDGELSHSSPIHVPVRPKTEGSSRARMQQYSKSMRSHRPATVQNDANPPSSTVPLKMTIPTINPVFQASSHLSSLSSHTTMSQRIQHNNKIRYRSQTSESSSRPMSGASRRPHSNPNSKQRSSPRPNLHSHAIQCIPGVNLPDAVYCINTPSISSNDKKRYDHPEAMTTTYSANTSTIYSTDMNDRDVDDDMSPFFDPPRPVTSNRVKILENGRELEVEDWNIETNQLNDSSSLYRPMKSKGSDGEEDISLHSSSQYQTSLSL